MYKPQTVKDRFLRYVGPRGACLLSFGLIAIAYGIGLVLGYHPTFVSALHLSTYAYGYCFIASGIAALYGTLKRMRRMPYIVAIVTTSFWFLVLAVFWTNPYGWTAGLSWLGIDLIVIIAVIFPEILTVRKVDILKPALAFADRAATLTGEKNMGGIPENAKPGDFFLVSFDGKNPNLGDPKKWALNGGLIRLGQWANGDGFGQYEHAAMYLGNGKIVEAGNSGVAINDYHYQSNDTMWSTGIINPTDAQRAEMVKAGTGYVGTPYSWPDYAAMAAVRFKLPLSSKFLKDYVATSKHMICSQLVDQIYQDAGYHLFDDGRWPGYVTPADLYNLLMAKSMGA